MSESVVPAISATLGLYPNAVLRKEKLGQMLSLACARPLGHAKSVSGERSILILAIGSSVQNVPVLHHQALAALGLSLAPLLAAMTVVPAVVPAALLAAPQARTLAVAPDQVTAMNARAVANVATIAVGARVQHHGLHRHVLAPMVRQNSRIIPVGCTVCLRRRTDA